MNLIDMSKQDILNKSYEGLYRQGKAGWSHKEFFCKYYSKDGVKCAVGILFDDDTAKYLEAISGSIEEVRLYMNRTEEENQKVAEFINLNINILLSMQTIHDFHLTNRGDEPYPNRFKDKTQPRNPEEFRKFLTYHYKELAKEHGLKLKINEAKN
jgi:hypothetical protein